MCRPVVEYTDCATAMRPFTKLLCPLVSINVRHGLRVHRRTWLQLPTVHRTHGRSTLQVRCVCGRGWSMMQRSAVTGTLSTADTRCRHSTDRLCRPRSQLVEHSLHSVVSHLHQAPNLQNIARFIIYDYRKFIARSTYDGDLKRAEISVRNIVSYFANTISDDITILHVNLTYENLSIHYPRESFREGLCNHRRWFVCLFVCPSVCLFVTTITK